MDCNPSGSSLHGMLQARILEWLATSCSKGIFPTQGWNLGLLHCRQILYRMSHQGSPKCLYMGQIFTTVSIYKNLYHHWLKGHEFEWTPGAGDGQGGLVCCDSWGRQESETTERLNWTEQNWTKSHGRIPWRRDRLPIPVFLGFPTNSVGKESACNAEDLDSIPGLGRCPGEGNGYPLQYSGLENSMDCIVHGVTKSLTRLSDFLSFAKPAVYQLWDRKDMAIAIFLFLPWHIKSEIIRKKVTFN